MKKKSSKYENPETIISQEIVRAKKELKKYEEMWQRIEDDEAVDLDYGWDSFNEYILSLKTIQKILRYVDFKKIEEGFKQLILLHELANIEVEQEGVEEFLMSDGYENNMFDEISKILAEKMKDIGITIENYNPYANMYAMPNEIFEETKKVKLKIDELIKLTKEIQK